MTETITIKLTQLEIQAINAEIAFYFASKTSGNRVTPFIPTVEYYLIASMAIIQKKLMKKILSLMLSSPTKGKEYTMKFEMLEMLSFSLFFETFTMNDPMAINARERILSRMLSEIIKLLRT